MGLEVVKFGGTSLADSKKIKHAADIVFEKKRSGQDIVVVVSAMGHVTDWLKGLGEEITSQPDRRETDVLLSTGEQISISLMAMALQTMGAEAVSFTGAQVGILTDAIHTRARIRSIDTERLEENLKLGKICIVAGFQGMTEKGDITTLGRGASDTTAVAIAAVLNAEVCEIYTDVEGIFTADPRIVPEARKLDRISYDAMLELASLGAQVLHMRSVEMAKNHGVRIHVRSTFSGKPGTLVGGDDTMEGLVISGIASNVDEAKLSILGVPDRPGVAATIFGTLAEKAIDVDMIVQSVGEDGLNTVSFTVKKDDLEESLKTLEQVQKEVGGSRVESDSDTAKISVVGVGMRGRPGIAAAMFQALAAEGINIQMISTSEIKISVIIDRGQAEAAVRALHGAFDLAEVPQAG